MDVIREPTTAVTDTSAETLNRFASRDKGIRNSDVIEIFKRHFPQISKETCPNVGIAIPLKTPRLPPSI